MQQPITRHQVEELQQQDKPVKLIDIRRPEEYEKMHVPGAVNIPAETITGNSAAFAANDIIVCICNKGLERAKNAAEVIAEMGFTNVFYLQGGTVGWLGESF